MSAALKAKKTCLSNVLHLSCEARASLDQNLSYGVKSVMDLGSPECCSATRQQAERKLAASSRAFFTGSPFLTFSERYRSPEVRGKVEYAMALCICHFLCRLLYRCSKNLLLSTIVFSLI